MVHRHLLTADATTNLLHGHGKSAKVSFPYYLIHGCAAQGTTWLSENGTRCQPVVLVSNELPNPVGTCARHDASARVTPKSAWDRDGGKDSIFLIKQPDAGSEGERRLEWKQSRESQMLWAGTNEDHTRRRWVDMRGGKWISVGNCGVGHLGIRGRGAVEELRD